MNGSDNSRAAAKDLDEILKSNPNHIEDPIGRARIHALRGRREKSIAETTKVIGLDPRNWQALRFRGNMLVNQGNEEAALKDFEAALAINPCGSSALLSRAKIVWNFESYHGVKLVDACPRFLDSVDANSYEQASILEADTQLNFNFNHDHQRSESSRAG